MISFDAHVHIQEIFSIDILLDSARGNFARLTPPSPPDQPAAYFLLLAEAKKYCFHQSLKESMGKGRPGGWQVTAAPEPESLLLTREDWPNGRLFILAGRQIVTAEKIEVLALATTGKIADQLSLAETVESVREHKGLVVLPWGAGKWLGKRAEIIEGFLKSIRPEGIFVGDNGGRPKIWPTPRPFLTAAARGIGLLPGSDPLPLANEELRVGSYGGWVEGDCSNDHPAAEFKKLLTLGSQPIVPFGRRLGSWQFLKSQIALRL